MAGLAARVDLLQKAATTNGGLLIPLQTDAPTPNAILLKSGRPNSTLFCVHPLGGGISPYLSFAESIVDEASVYGFTLWDQTGRSIVVDSIPKIARSYIEQMMDLQKDGPYLLSGWSSGGIIAHEMACQLSDKGKTVDMLAIIDAYPPSELSYSAKDRSLGIWYTLLDLFGLSHRRSQVRDPKFLDLTQDEKITLVLSTLKREKSISTIPSREQLLYYMESIKEFRSAAIAHEYRKYSGEVSLFLAEITPVSTSIAVDFWRKHSTMLLVDMIPGDHLSIMQGTAVRKIADRVNKKFSEHPLQ